MTNPYKNLTQAQRSKLINYLIEGNDIEDICEMFLETLTQEGVDELLADADNQEEGE